MSIRKAQIKDIEGINNLLCQVLMVHHNGRPDIFKPNEKKYTDEELAQIIKDETRPIFLYEEEAEILGYAFCIIQKHENNNILADIKTLYIDDLCVDELTRGKNIGRKYTNMSLNMQKKQVAIILHSMSGRVMKEQLNSTKKWGLFPKKQAWKNYFRNEMRK